MKNQYIILASVFLGALFLLPRCTDDETLNSQAGTLVLKITDVASDDEDIEGIFITVSDVKLDGKSIRNFKPQKIEISKLVNGHTSLLIEKDLPAKSYNKLTMVLSAGTNTPDSVPGCYVLTTNNVKHNLIPFDSNISNMEISASKTIELLPATENNLVVDFNLRKAIIRKNSTKSKYSFVTQPELEKAIRLVNEKNTGSIIGNIRAKDLQRNHLYVLLYRKGEFDPLIEGTGYGKSNILFSNSITSSKVEPDGNFYLPFIEEGDYEIRLANYRQIRDNVFIYNGILDFSGINNKNYLDSINVTASSETELNILLYPLM